jgi:hypothetical protein
VQGPEFKPSNKKKGGKEGGRKEGREREREREKGMLLNLFYEATITLIPNQMRTQQKKRKL